MDVQVESSPAAAAWLRAARRTAEGDVPPGGMAHSGETRGISCVEKRSQNGFQNSAVFAFYHSNSPFSAERFCGV